MIGNVIESSDLRPHVLAMPSTDNHQVVSWVIWWGKPLDRLGKAKRVVRCGGHPWSGKLD